MKTIPVTTHVFQCEICGSKYDNEVIAQKCEESGRVEMPEGIEIGDEIIVPSYGILLFRGKIKAVGHKRHHYQIVPISARGVLVEWMEDDEGRPDTFHYTHYFYHVKSKKIITLEVV